MNDPSEYRPPVPRDRNPEGPQGGRRLEHARSSERGSCLCDGQPLVGSERVLQERPAIVSGRPARPVWLDRLGSGHQGDQTSLPAGLSSVGAPFPCLDSPKGFRAERYWKTENRR